MTLKTTNVLIGVVVAAIVVGLSLSQPKAGRKSTAAPAPEPAADAAPVDPDHDPTRPCYPDCRQHKDAERAFVKRWLQMTTRERSHVEVAIEQGQQLETLERVGADRATKCVHARIAADAWLAVAEDDLYRAAARRVTEWCS